MKLTPHASRAARGLLEWSLRDLAREAGVSVMTVQRLERGHEFFASTAEKVMSAFERHGVEILNGDSPGARIRKPAASSG